MPRQPISIKNTLSAPSEGVLRGSESHHTRLCHMTLPHHTVLWNHPTNPTAYHVGSPWAALSAYEVPVLFVLCPLWLGVPFPHPGCTLGQLPVAVPAPLWPDLRGHVSLTSQNRGKGKTLGPWTAFPTPPATNGCITTVSFTMTNVLDVIVLWVCVFPCIREELETGVMSSVHQKTNKQKTKQNTHNRYKNKLRSKFLLHFPLLLWLFACLASNQKFTWKLAVIPFPCVLNDYKPTCMFADFMFLEFET